MSRELRSRAIVRGVALAVALVANAIGAGLSDPDPATARTIGAGSVQNATIHEGFVYWSEQLGDASSLRRMEVSTGTRQTLFNIAGTQGIRIDGFGGGRLLFGLVSGSIESQVDTYQTAMAVELASGLVSAVYAKPPADSNSLCDAAWWPIGIDSSGSSYISEVTAIGMPGTACGLVRYRNKTIIVNPAGTATEFESEISAWRLFPGVGRIADDRHDQSDLAENFLDEIFGDWMAYRDSPRTNATRLVNRLTGKEAVWPKIDLTSTSVQGLAVGTIYADETDDLRTYLLPDVGDASRRVRVRNRLMDDAFFACDDRFVRTIETEPPYSVGFRGGLRIRKTKPFITVFDRNGTKTAHKRLRLKQGSDPIGCDHSTLLLQWPGVVLAEGYESVGKRFKPILYTVPIP